MTYTATDAAGNIGTATQTVTVTDTTVPVIIAPAGVAADSINGGDPVVNLGTATATDLFAVTITNDAPAIFSAGVTTVVWTATDANGNSSAATQLVTVTLMDTLPPVITTPANVYTSTSTSQATVDIGIASANDNVDGMVAVTNDAPATYPIGVTTVTYTSSDSAGNTATATQQVYVSYSSTVGGGSGGTTTPPPAGGGATVGMEAVYFHHNDHLGTPQAMTDINGTKVWEMSQTPFGITTVNEDVDGDGLLVVNNFRFPGQYFDAETGLNYNYFRTYDPILGRYSQSDPIGLDGGMNTFGYVGGNPLFWSDPLGLQVWGINSGGSFTIFGTKFTGSTAFLFDSNGSFSIITTQEAGAGKGKSAGLFFNGVWGGGDTLTSHYSGTGTSLSGSRGPLSVAVSLPDYDDCGKARPFYEAGFSRSIGTAEAGVTRTFGQEVFSSDILGNTGRWWGNHIYGWTH